MNIRLFSGVTLRMVFIIRKSRLNQHALLFLLLHYPLSRSRLQVTGLIYQKNIFYLNVMEFISSEIDFRRTSIIERTVTTLVTVKIEPAGKPVLQFPDAAFLIQIDFLLLHRPPKPLNNRTCQRPNSPVPTDSDFVLF